MKYSDDCERCKASSLTVTTQERKLLGGVYATLCNKCLTEWVGICEGLPANSRLNKAQARVTYLAANTAGRQPPSEKEWLDALEEQSAAEQGFRNDALAFIGDRNDPAGDKAELAS